ncbi:MAG: DNA-binding protein [Euryarchaeota archaeon]|nr:DNA-binding protein [Euryarchaeota archaeon]
MKGEWIPTRDMAALVGCSRRTLSRMQTAGYFIEGQHWQKLNPLAPRSNFVWHRTRVLIKMGRA